MGCIINSYVTLLSIVMLFGVLFFYGVKSLMRTFLGWVYVCCVGLLRVRCMSSYFSVARVGSFAD